MNKVLFFLFLVVINTGSSLLAQCIDNGNYWNESWVSCEPSTNPNPERADGFWLLFEFHEGQFIDTSYVWNANRFGESGFGIKEVIVDYFTEENDWQSLGLFTFPQAPETDDYTGFLGPIFGGIYLEKILFTVISTHDNGNCASLAEVQFFNDENACIGTIDECGVCNGTGEITWYIDADNDGLGDNASIIIDCQQPEGYVSNGNDPCDNGNLGWSDIASIFDESGCNTPYCHGGSAGGLDLSTYASTSNGGNKCGTDLLIGTKLVDIITMAGYDECSSEISLPAMNNRTENPMDTDDLAKIQAWIDGGAPEFCEDFATSSTSLFESSNVLIYPNPTKDFINIDNIPFSQFKSQLYTLTGKKILVANNQKSIDISKLNTGFYILELSSFDGTWKVTNKIFKLD